MSPYVTALLVYSIFLMAIGWWTSRSVRRAEDFFVAGRRLSPALLFGTLLAANLGAGSTVGATGLGYTHGISAWWWVGSAGIGSLILGLTVGPRMWRVAKEQNLYTVGDYLEHRYSRGVRGLIAVLLWFGSLAILAGQLIPLAWILNLTLGIPKYVACLAGGAVVVVYFTFGGLTSTARVNMVQLVVKLSGFILAFLMIVSGAGLLSGEGAAPTGFESWFGDDPSRIWGYFIVLVPAFIISPGLSAEDLRRPGRTGGPAGRLHERGRPDALRLHTRAPRHGGLPRLPVPGFSGPRAAPPADGRAALLDRRADAGRRVLRGDQFPRTPCSSC